MSDTTTTTPNLDFSNLQTIVNPYDFGQPFREFLDPSYVAVVKSLTIDHVRRIRPDEQFNLQLISYREYGTIDLWWIIGMVNAIVNPFVEVVQGMELNIPTLGSIQDYFKQAKTRTSTGVVSLP